MKVGGIFCIVFAFLLFCVAAFFGYFSCANFGSAERLAVGLPEGAEFAVQIVENKAWNQLTYAAVAFGASTLFFIVGVVLVFLGRKKK